MVAEAVVPCGTDLSDGPRFGTTPRSSEDLQTEFPRGDPPKDALVAHACVPERIHANQFRSNRGPLAQPPDRQHAPFAGTDKLQYLDGAPPRVSSRSRVNTMRWNRFTGST